MFKANLHEPALSWESQARQYPETGPAGFSYFPGETEAGTVDCLLYRDISGTLLGILNYYPMDFPPWEKAGNVNMWVMPSRQRQGIGSALWKEACNRWDIALEGQRFTVAGARLANHLAKAGFA